MESSSSVVTMHVDTEVKAMDQSGDEKEVLTSRAKRAAPWPRSDSSSDSGSETELETPDGDCEMDEKVAQETEVGQMETLASMVSRLFSKNVRMAKFIGADGYTASVPRKAARMSKLVRKSKTVDEFDVSGFAASAIDSVLRYMVFHKGKDCSEAPETLEANSGNDKVWNRDFVAHLRVSGSVAAVASLAKHLQIRSLERLCGMSDTVVFVGKENFALEVPFAFARLCSRVEEPGEVDIKSFSEEAMSKIGDFLVHHEGEYSADLWDEQFLTDVSLKKVAAIKELAEHLGLQPVVDLCAAVKPRMLTLLGKDGYSVQVPKDYACMSTTISDMYSLDDSATEFALHDYEGKIIDVMLEYLYHHKGEDNNKINKPISCKDLTKEMTDQWNAAWISEKCEDRAVFFPLIALAHYLYIGPLLNLCGVWYAATIKGIERKKHELLFSLNREDNLKALELTDYPTPDEEGKTEAPVSTGA